MVVVAGPVGVREHDPENRNVVRARRCRRRWDTTFEKANVPVGSTPVLSADDLAEAAPTATSVESPIVEVDRPLCLDAGADIERERSTNRGSGHNGLASARPRSENADQ